MPWPHLRRYGVHAGAVLVALVEDEAQLPEEHREHPQVLLEFPEPVLVSRGVVGHAVGELRRTQCVKRTTKVLPSGKCFLRERRSLGVLLHCNCFFF